MAFLLELHNQIMESKRRLDRAQEEIELMIERLDDLKGRAWFCPNCEKFYPKESLEHHASPRTTTETVYTDAGYGDDDEIAEVTRMIQYNDCPVCGYSVQMGEGTVIGVKDRRLRRG